MKSHAGRIWTPSPSWGWLEIEGGVVSGVMNRESLGVGALGRRPRHDVRAVTPPRKAKTRVCEPIQSAKPCVHMASA